MPLSTFSPAASARAVSGTIPIPAKTSWGSSTVPPDRWTDVIRPDLSVSGFLLPGQCEAGRRAGGAGPRNDQTARGWPHGPADAGPVQPHEHQDQTRAKRPRLPARYSRHRSPQLCAHASSQPAARIITSGAQHMQIRGPVRQVRQRPGISPGRQHKMIIRQGAAICQAELLLTGVKRGHRTSRPEGDLEIVKPVLLAQGKGPFPIGKISFEIGFGQRRALQRQTRVTFRTVIWPSNPPVRRRSAQDRPAWLAPIITIWADVAIITSGSFSTAACQTGRQDECEKTRPRPGFQCRNRRKMKKIAAPPSRKADKGGRIRHSSRADTIFEDRIDENDGCNHNR